MGRTTCGMVIALGLAACSSDAPAPSCRQAFGSFFAAGCAWVDPDHAVPDPEGVAVAVCQYVERTEPRCRVELDDWMRCLADASPTTQCDCAPEEAAVDSCAE